MIATAKPKGRSLNCRRDQSGPLPPISFVRPQGNLEELIGQLRERLNQAQQFQQHIAMEIAESRLLLAKIELASEP